MELLIHMVFFGLSAALGALFGQRHVDDLVGLLFGKRPMGLGAVGVARLAPGVFGSCLGVPLENGAAWRFWARVAFSRNCSS